MTPAMSRGETKGPGLISSLVTSTSVWLVAFTGLTLSVATFLIIQHQMALHKRLDFDWAVQNRYRALQKEIDKNLMAVTELRHLLAGFEKVTRKNFQTSAQAILSTYSEVEALAWIPKVSLKARSGFIADARSHDPNYRIHTNEEAEPTRYSQPIHYPILFVEPALENPELPGLDLITTPLWRAPLERARASGEMSVGEWFLPHAWPDSKARIGAFLALYRPEISVAALGQSLENLQGFVAGIMRIDALVEASIGHLEPRGIDIWLHAQSRLEAREVLFTYQSRLATPEDPIAANPPPHTPRMRMTDQLQVGDRSWRFTGEETPRFRSAQAFHEGPWLVLLEGCLFTLLLSLYLYRLKRDMRIRLEMENALQESNERLGTLLAHSPDIILTLDQSGTILFINRACPGLGLEKVDGVSFLDALAVNCRRRYEKALTRVFEHNQVGYVLCSHPDYSWWDARVAPVQRDGKVTTAMVILRDVTENQILQAQAIRSARLASLGVLAASVAHEINNPNSAIRFNASILQRALGDILPVIERHHDENPGFAVGGMPVEEALTTLPKLLQGVSSSSNRIKKIVANLKHMAQQDRGGNDDQVSIPDALHAAVSILQNKIKKHTDHFQLAPKKELPPVRGNIQQLEQVFINIILNALQSLPDRGKGVAVAAELEESGEYLSIKIQDQGCGIPKERLSMITEPFFTTKEESGGTGLGLSLSDRIIRNHGGRLSYESSPGEGTLAAIRLPVIPSTLDGLQT
ncbi:MAG: CHASE domain-containing protein [Magnetococcales bacterium]|nr:CHASE domain-containing protein [Magnetococcales bacterium]